ncbi:leucine-rich repeat-containing protein 70-like [Acipenser ruthenus]|uniref:leucine-rich repeat-containing protein 70-like n=1 Tax=Acipenser ruthenus TaxID=7906 RepID=UPI0015615E50|nr:leucine-rich repeat-containing protein 70-like [Acipenser ruthenus]
MFRFCSSMTSLKPFFSFHLCFLLTLLHNPNLGCPLSCQQCSITRVQCCSLGLTFVPRNLSRSTAVVHLSGNNISRICAEDLRSLDKLSVLYLDNTGLLYIEDKAMRHLHKLYYLYLNDNQIERLDPETFRGLSDLHYLYLHHNEIHFLPDGMFADLIALRYLHLQGNRLKKVGSGVFLGMTSLKILNLANNRISRISNSAFMNLGKLEILYLKGNNLGQIASDVFAGLGNVKRLDLSNNPVESVPPFAFKGLENLQYLIVEHARIKHIDKNGFAKLPNLKQLTLSHNNLNCIGSDAFALLRQLKYLHLDRNNISHIGSEAFEGMAASLKVLNLGQNNLKYMQSDVLQPLVSLIHVQATKNPWNCSCQLLGLHNWLVSSTVMMNVHCQHPPQLQGKLLRYVNLNKFGVCAVPNATIIPVVSSTASSLIEHRVLIPNKSTSAMKFPILPSGKSKSYSVHGGEAVEHTKQATTAVPLQIPVQHPPVNLTTKNKSPEGEDAPVSLKPLLICEQRIAKLNQGFDILLVFFIFACVLILAMLYKLLHLKHRLKVVEGENVLEYFSFYQSAHYNVREPASPPPNLLPAAAPDVVGNITAGQMGPFKQNNNGNQAQVILFEHSVL